MIENKLEKSLSKSRTAVSANPGAKFFCHVGGARARGINDVKSRITPGAGTPGRFRFPLIDACRLPVGRLRDQSLRSVPPGLNAVARAFVAARRRAGNGPSHDHVTTWRSGLCSTRSLVCQYAQTTLALYVLLRPISSSRRPSPSLSRMCIYIRMYTYMRYLPAQCTHCLPHACIIYSHYARGRVRTELTCTCIYTCTHACIYAERLLETCSDMNFTRDGRYGSYHDTDNGYIKISMQFENNKPGQVNCRQ